MKLQLLVLEALIEASKQNEGAADASEVAKVLRSRYGIERSSRAVRTDLERLVARGWAKRVETLRKVLYVPARVPKGQQKTLQEFEEYTKTVIRPSEPESREGVGAKIEAEFEEPSIAEEIAQLLREREGHINRVIDGVAEKIAEENPKEVLLRLLKGYEKLFHNYSKRYVSGSAEERKNALDKMEEIERRVTTIFGRVLGIPISKRRRESLALGEAIRIVLPTPSDPKAVFEFKEELVKKYLERRIPDDRFVEFVAPRSIENFVYVGIDSSSVPVEVFVPRISPRKVEVIVNAAITTRLKGGEEREPVTELFPRPEDVAEMRTREAEKRGYIISPFTYYSLPERFRVRLREAQMNTLEHGVAVEQLRTMPDVVYLDGRIFPYEHTVDDYTVAPHREAVKRSLEVFRELLDVVESRRRITVLVGVVKRGALGYLWPMVQWIAYEEGIIEEDDLFAGWQRFEKVFFDGYIALKLLHKIMQQRGETDNVLRTFVVLRRFYAMDDKLRAWFGRSTDKIELEDDDVFWQYELRTNADNPGIAGYIGEWGHDEREAWLYSQLCAFAVTAMFYFLPPLRQVDWDALETYGKPASLPRFEVLVPHSMLHSLKGIQDYVGMAIVDSEVPTERGSEDLYVLYDHTKEYSTFVPSPVKTSHELAVKRASQLSEVYAHFLLMRINELLVYGSEAEV